MNNDIQQIINALIQFRDERDWEQFHNPKDLSIALSIEANELLELFLWKNADEAKTEKVKMDFFSVMKVNSGKMDWIKNNSIKEMEKLIQTPPKQKKAPAYTGNRFKVQNFVAMNN